MPFVTEPVANRDHVCTKCRTVIWPSDSYVRKATPPWEFDGYYWHVEKKCGECIDNYNGIMGRG